MKAICLASWSPVMAIRCTALNGPAGGAGGCCAAGPDALAGRIAVHRAILRKIMWSLPLDPVQASQSTHVKGDRLRAGVTCAFFRPLFNARFYSARSEAQPRVH